MTKQRSVRLPQWREDFPIRWDDDHYVTRRELVKFFTLGSALLVGANGAIAVAAHKRTTRTYDPKFVCAQSQLAPDESLLFGYPTEEDPCILIRTSSGEWVAFSQICTHLSCAVVYRKEDGRLFCPCHKGVFACGPGKRGAEPLEGPPERPLPRVELELRHGKVFAIGMVV